MTISSIMPVLSAVNLSRTFGSTQALRGVSLDLYPGRIHALVGENGAGKSTLIRILAGLERSDTGHILIADHCVTRMTPREAQELGILTVPQHLELAEDLPICDNLFLHRWPTRGPVIRRSELRDASRRLLDGVGCSHLSPDQPVSSLAYVEKQMLEIARVTDLFNPRVIVLDEPTGALSLREIRILFQIIRTLCERGVAVLYVSHFLSEIAQIADEISILRDGLVVDFGIIRAFSTERIIHSMVGPVPDLYPRPPAPEGDSPKVFEVDSLRCLNSGPLSFSLVSGEILGICAPKDEGISELLRVMARIRTNRVQGSIKLDGKNIDSTSSHRLFRAGLGYLSEERHRWGILKGKNVRENLSVTLMRRLRTRWRTLDRAREGAKAMQMIDQFGIKTAGTETPIEALSGGNQQKTLVARLLGAELKVLIFDDPTLGVDVRSKAEINRLISDAVAGGAAMLLATSDLAELAGMCHRVLVVRNGCIAREMQAGEFTIFDLESELSVE